jgi:hypothetical protein
MTQFKDDKVFTLIRKKIKISLCAFGREAFPKDAFDGPSIPPTEFFLEGIRIGQ